MVFPISHSSHSKICFLRTCKIAFRVAILTLYSSSVSTYFAAAAVVQLSNSGAGSVWSRRGGILPSFRRATQTTYGAAAAAAAVCQALATALVASAILRGDSAEQKEFQAKDELQTRKRRERLCSINSAQQTLHIVQKLLTPKKNLFQRVSYLLFFLKQFFNLYDYGK